MAQPNDDGGRPNTQLGFEADLFKTADKLRGNMEPSDYKHVALGLIFLKYISDAFEARHAELLAEDEQAAEDKDEYLADNIFWVPKDARWSHLKANAKRPEIGTLIDDAMRAIEKDNESLKGVLPKDYARPALNKVMLGELIDLISGIGLLPSPLAGEGPGERGRSYDVLGRVYEYFLSQFAGAEGKRGGEFYTPRSVVQVLVKMLEPYSGRVYDPCCGSGGMFVQSEKFVLEHGGRIGDIAIYGQESNYTTWRLAKMNLAVRGIDADIQKIADTYHAWRSNVGASLVPAQDKGDHVGAGLVPAQDKGDHKGRPYEDIPGFCKSATLEEIRKHGHVLTPGRYVGAEAAEDDGEAFTDKMQRLSAQWREQQAEAARLDAAIEANLRELGYGA